MCGICGIYNYGTGDPADRGRIEAMTATLAHRGPDDEGYHLDGPLGFGFRRLSIIDLKGGRQPMADPGGTVWVAFNGEIYNFPELRAGLEARGYVFRTRSDTEVIVHGYREWGDGVLDRLNGMFGLAVWDAPNRRLMLARDRLGIKMVYYRDDGRCVAFGSEVRPVLAWRGERPGIDPVALNLFLRYRYTPSPLTLFEGIRKLAPGCRLIAEDGGLRVERWWRSAPRPFDPPPSDEEAEEAVADLYRRAIRRQLLSDVPLGLLLSGGVDSALLLALMNGEGGPWNTYTVGYGKSFKDDELDDARRTTALLGGVHHPVRIDRAVFEETLPGIIETLEEPVASSSVVPMWHVCRRARQDVKVALVGQGPDELFGGYARHLGVAYGSYWRGLPDRLKTPAGVLLERFSRSESVRRGLRSLDVPERIRRYQAVFSIVPGEQIDGLFRGGILPDGAGDTILDIWRPLEPMMAGLDELGGLQFLELRFSLPDELLMYADKLSMAHGLEVRVPYLDHEIVEYVERLGDGYKVRRGRRKWLHRRVARRYLPAEILKRRKRGFAVNVVDQWFRDVLGGEMARLIPDGSSLMYEFLDPGSAGRLFRDHREGRADYHKILFSLVVFESWLRLYRRLPVPQA